MEFQRRRKIKRRLYSKTSLVLVVLLLVILIRPTWDILQKYFASGRNLKEIQGELDKLKGRGQYLQSEMENLKSREGAEKEILSKFDVVREGEEVAVILPPADADSGKVGKKSLWQKFKGFLTRLFRVD